MFSCFLEKIFYKCVHAVFPWHISNIIKQATVSHTQNDYVHVGRRCWVVSVPPPLWCVLHGGCQHPPGRNFSVSGEWPRLPHHVLNTTSPDSGAEQHKWYQEWAKSNGATMNNCLHQDRLGLALRPTWIAYKCHRPHVEEEEEKERK